ncbi:hypothetical protein [Chitinasiproducens palmae]|uniref:Bacteriophage protein n=1 Tax=Chitinasiproducens palmae TaxID=1770053 RepID=A0A1H2PSF8_9BURK|nr:hypothetical protein [Chitinasiproducens palmae]SDV49072.1 hypothetical protein SAMN05216551_10742 [Chitinasiproducens palmae]
MRYRKLDANGDYVFGGQQADFYRDQVDGIAQAVRTRLALLTGEWFLDITEGTPWHTDVLGKYTSAVYDSAIRNRILSTDGVNSIESYSSTVDRDARRLTVSVQIDTIYGATTLQETI